MNTVLQVTVGVWAILVAVVLSLALYRLLLSRGDYTVLHVRRSEMSLIPEQIMHDHRIQKVDFLGRSLTVVALVLGLMLAIAYIYLAISPML